MDKRDLFEKIKGLSLEEKEKTIRENLPPEEAEAIIEKLRQRAQGEKKPRPKKKVKTPENQPQDASLSQVVRKNSELQKILAYLQRCMLANTAIPQEKADKIARQLSTDDYFTHHELYDAIIRLSFRYSRSPIKVVAKDFLKKILIELHFVDNMTILNLLTGGYISSKTYEILHDCCQIINEKGEITLIVYRELEKMYKEGRNYNILTQEYTTFTPEKMEMLKELIPLYQPTV